MALEGYGDNDAKTYKNNDIDSDGDGTVDQADDALLYKGNDIDSNGDGTVDAAVNVTSTYKGNDIDTDGDGVVNQADDALLYKGNDIDSDGDGVVNNSNQLEGNTTSQVRNHTPNNHASRHHNGGADALDAGNLSGSSGSNGQILHTTGSAAQWQNLSVNISSTYTADGGYTNDTWYQNTTGNPMIICGLRRRGGGQTYAELHGQISTTAGSGESQMRSRYNTGGGGAGNATAGVTFVVPDNYYWQIISGDGNITAIRTFEIEA